MLHWTDGVAIISRPDRDSLGYHPHFKQILFSFDFWISGLGGFNVPGPAKFPGLLIRNADKLRNISSVGFHFPAEFVGLQTNYAKCRVWDPTFQEVQNEHCFFDSGAQGARISRSEGAVLGYHPVSAGPSISKSD